MTDRPRYLFVADQPLFSTLACRELLDMALSAAAFDMDSALLLRGPAALWVATTAGKPDAIRQKDLFRQLGALPVYGINRLYVAEQDLLPYCRKPALDSCTALDQAAVRALYHDYDRIIQL